MPGDSVYVSVRLDRELVEAADRLASERHTNRSDAIRIALRSALLADRPQPRPTAAHSTEADAGFRRNWERNHPGQRWPGGE